MPILGALVVFAGMVLIPFALAAIPGVGYFLAVAWLVFFGVAVFGKSRR